MAVSEVNMTMFGELIAMGFSSAQATRGLYYSGNTSVEEAINWIIDHEDDPEIDRMPQVLVDINIDSDEPFHLTEEVKRKAQELRDRAQNKKEEEKRSERETDKARVRSGKELLEAKRIAEENERKRYLALKQLEKEGEKKAREKIHCKLEQDKLERRGKNQAFSKLSAASGKEKLGSKCAVKTVSKVDLMRECLRSIKCHNRDDDAKTKRAFQTLLIYVGNIARNPNEEKFRKIRMSNPLFEDRVGSLKGGVEFLELCGFERTEFLYLSRENIDMTVLTSAALELKSAITNPFFGLFCRKNDAV